MKVQPETLDAVKENNPDSLGGEIENQRRGGKIEREQKTTSSLVRCVVLCCVV